MAYEKEINLIKKIILNRYPETSFGIYGRCSCLMCGSFSLKGELTFKSQELNDGSVYFEVKDLGRFVYTEEEKDIDLVSFFLQSYPEFTPNVLLTLALANELKEIVDGR